MAKTINPNTDMPVSTAADGVCPLESLAREFHRQGRKQWTARYSSPAGEAS